MIRVIQCLLCSLPISIISPVLCACSSLVDFHDWSPYFQSWPVHLVDYLHHYSWRISGNCPCLFFFKKRNRFQEFQSCNFCALFSLSLRNIFYVKPCGSFNIRKFAMWLSASENLFCIRIV